MYHRTRGSFSLPLLAFVITLGALLAACSTVPVATTDASGMKFTSIKGGCYEMGDTFDAGEHDEVPAHGVCVEDFSIGTYEVTVAQFKTFAAETGYITEAEKAGGCYIYTPNQWRYEKSATWRSPGFPQEDRHPVTCVSFNDAQAFTAWLTKKTGKSYRLPREAEWEYVARSGGKSYKYSWGNEDPSGNVADESARKEFPELSVWEGYNDGFVYTAPVGSFKTNDLGVYDMSGNVWEWCEDWYEKEYYKASPKDNPKGPGEGTRRVVRGASWFDIPQNQRAANRGSTDPSKANVITGFRVVAPGR
jgi:sulfatase modifying factor 1